MSVPAARHCRDRERRPGRVRRVRVSGRCRCALLLVQAALAGSVRAANAQPARPARARGTAALDSALVGVMAAGLVAELDSFGGPAPAALAADLEPSAISASEEGRRQRELDGVAPWSGSVPAFVAALAAAGGGRFVLTPPVRQVHTMAARGVCADWERALAATPIRLGIDQLVVAADSAVLVAEIRASYRPRPSAWSTRGVSLVVHRAGGTWGRLERRELYTLHGNYGCAAGKPAGG